MYFTPIPHCPSPPIPHPPYFPPIPNIPHISPPCRLTSFFDSEKMAFLEMFNMYLIIFIVFSQYLVIFRVPEGPNYVAHRTSGHGPPRIRPSWI